MGKSKFHLKLKKSQVIRHLIQLAAFLLTPGLFISAFGAVKDVYTAILGGTFSLGALSYQLLLLAAVVPVTVLLGRFFCGYFCSFGALGDAVWFVAGKIHKKRLDIGKRADRILKLLKYAVLAFLVVLIWTLGLVRFDSVDSPWTIFGMFASFSGWPSASFLLTSGAALLLLIIAGSALIERFFCRYLCPLGAIFSILSLPRLFRVSKPRAACGPCTLCMKKCAMGIALNEADTVASGECINCFKCVDACPRCNVRANPAPAVATALATAAIAGLAYAGSLTAEAGLEAQSATISDNAAATVSGPIAILAPGTYSVAASASTAASGASCIRHARGRFCADRRGGPHRLVVYPHRHRRLRGRRVHRLRDGLPRDHKGFSDRLGRADHGGTGRLV